MTKVLQGLVYSPLLGFGGALLLLFGLLWPLARARPVTVDRRVRQLQIVSAACMAYSHGGNDAQKTMGVITHGAGQLPRLDRQRVRRSRSG